MRRARSPSSSPRPRSVPPLTHSRPTLASRLSHLYAGMTDPPDDPHEFISVTLEAKDVLKFLASYSVASTTIACASSSLGSRLSFSLTMRLASDGADLQKRAPTGFCRAHAAIFYVYVGAERDSSGAQGSGGVLTFFVPAVQLGGDD